MIADPVAKAWSVLWWARGACLVMCIVSLVPRFVDVSEYDVVTALYAAVLSWRDLMAFIGQIVGLIPIIPDIHPVIVEGFLFFVSTFAMGSYIELRQAIKTQAPEEKTKFTTIIRQFISYTFSNSIFLLIFLYFYSTLFLERFEDSNLSEIVYFDNSLFQILYGFLFVGVVLIISMSFLLALRTSRAYRLGAAFVISALALILLLYHIGDPVLGEAIREWSNGVIESSKQ